MSGNGYKMLEIKGNLERGVTRPIFCNKTENETSSKINKWTSQTPRIFDTQKDSGYDQTRQAQASSAYSLKIETRARASSFTDLESIFICYAIADECELIHKK